MRRTSIYLLLLALAAPCAAADLPIDLERARQYFKEARSLSDRDKGRLWGTPLYGPLLFEGRPFLSIALPALIVALMVAWGVRRAM